MGMVFLHKKVLAIWKTILWSLKAPVIMHHIIMTLRRHGDTASGIKKNKLCFLTAEEANVLQ
jgi:hypothetical protein